MANLQLPLNQDHEVLGSEYCSGYTDALQKWNNGFYCPASDESQDVFCCGTENHKYCCTKKDQVVQAEVENFTVLVGIIVGATAAILILTLVSCFCCSCCILYKKRNPHSVSLYHFHSANDQDMGMIPPGGGILVGGPNHYASQHHLHASNQMMIDSQFQMHVLNGRDTILHHSNTLPHGFSNYVKGVGNSNPDLLSQHTTHVYHGTLGRTGVAQPPPYQDPPKPSMVSSQSEQNNPGFEMCQDLNVSDYKRGAESFLVNSISKGINTTGPAYGQPTHIIFPHIQHHLDEHDEKQLFHSTKF